MQHHIIQHQVFDVGFGDADRSYELQSKISDIFHNQLSDGMEQLFNRLIPADVVLSIEDITIDVGDMTYDELEYDLVDRILSELEREISYRLALKPSANVKDGDNFQAKALSTSYASLLEYFLLTGTMPWWATGDVMTDPLKVTEYLLANDTGSLRQLITTVGQHSYVRQRLVFQFSQQVIRDIIAVLEPAQAAFIFDYHATVVKTHQQEKLVESAPQTEFERSLWLFILTYILVDRGSLFNQKVFVRSTLSQLASYYNRAYAEVLALLNKALAKYSSIDNQANELLLIITDLSVDEFDDRQQVVKKRVNTTSAAVDEDELQQQLEILKHYLVFGSLPWWAEPYTQSNLETLVLALIKAIPNVLRKLIVSLGQTEDVRKRITTAFTDAVITGIVQILEPAEAAFIINYVDEIQEIHVKKPVVYTDSKSFKQAVWKFIFDFLILERGSEFNRRMFLQSNINKLAVNYNVQYTEMLMFLVQSIGQVHQDNIAQAPLFKLLAVLLNDNTAYTTHTATGFEPQSATATTETKRKVVLKDVLLYWLNYGSIPWWGNAYFEQRPVNMFLELLISAPEDAFTLLKYAGTVPNIRKRVLYQFPAQLIMDVFASQSIAADAIVHYEYLLQTFTSLIEKSPKGSTTTQAEAATMLSSLFWDVYTTAQYKTFNTAVFLQQGIYYLLTRFAKGQQKAITALKQLFDAAPATIYQQSLDAMLTGDKLNVDADAILSADEIKAMIAAGNIDVISPEAILELPEGDIETIGIDRLIAAYLSAKAPAEQDIITEALRILTHFTSTGKLPAQFKGTNPVYINAILKQLLQFLSKRSAKAYKQLLVDHSSLQEYVVDKKDAGAQIDGSIEQVIGEYLHREKQGGQATSTESILNEALSILQYFLTTGKLPKGIQTTRTGGNQQILKQLLLMLNYARPGALNDILQRNNALADAKMQLHNLFAITANTAENNVSRVLKAYLEKDIVQYIQTLSPGIKTDEQFIALVDQHLAASPANYQLVAAVLKNAAAARYIARYYTDKKVQQLLENNTALIGGTENVAWLDGLQLLIAHAVTDTLQRDRLSDLIREFNLLLIGGHMSIGNFTAYIKALFGFIAAQNNTLFVLLGNITAKADKTPGLPDVFTAKLPVVLSELNLQKARTKTGQDIKKQLTRADDDILQDVAGVNNAKQKNADTKQIQNDVKQRQQQLDEQMQNENKKAPVNSGEPVYINNAGLVLLNPFISTFFVRTGLMEGGKFITPDAQLRAVHLLQYLVNGATDSAEHLLVLNKILCNVAIEHPIPGEIVLTEHEKAVSGSLLKAVLASWDKLKNTSPEGLQGSFLQRDGALTFKDEAWNLKVEQRGYDVLLQSLPWGMSMIKMSWMEKFLYVEWI